MSEAVRSVFDWNPSGRRPERNELTESLRAPWHPHDPKYQPRRQVTEADQAVARAFGREVPELTEAPKPKPEEEMTALLEEFRDLRMSRRGDSREVANNAATVKRVLMSETVMEGPRLTYKITRPSQLADLRREVASLRAEEPLSGAVTESAAEVTWADVDESVARAFGRAPKGGQW
ncbi:hypothetical protein DXX98_02050 [Janibacter melonis]|nr:hypothetical protein [Janibacter melonis]